MYFKLAMRCAVRSLFDYLLYMITMVIFLMFLYISNYVACIANVEAGFQSMSLPLLIAILLIVLVYYINTFMIRQRAKEFANYILLGMEKKKVVNMFICELAMIGFLCFVVGMVLGFLVCYIVFHLFLTMDSTRIVSLSFQNLSRSVCYFLVMEVISLYSMKRRLLKLEIFELMKEKKRNQRLGGKQECYIWGGICLFTSLLLLFIICGFIWLPYDLVMKIVSFVSIPLLLNVFSFYKWLYYVTSLVRRRQPNSLYHKERLYMIVKVTCGTNASSIMHSVFCICLLLLSMSFVFGYYMLQSDGVFVDQKSQLWMGFLQICLCILFIVIYFSILSVRLIIDMQQQLHEFKILYFLGKGKRDLKRLIRKQILITLLFPTVLCFVFVSIGYPFINHGLQRMLPVESTLFVGEALGIFVVCFVMLYLMYYIVVNTISRRMMETSLRKQVG